MEISKKHVGVGTGLLALCLLTQCPEGKTAQSVEKKPTASASQDPELVEFRKSLGALVKAAEQMEEEPEPFTVPDDHEEYDMEAVRDCIESTGEFTCLDARTLPRETYCFFAGEHGEDQYPVSFIRAGGRFFVSDAAKPGWTVGEGFEVEGLTDTCRSVVDTIRTDIDEDDATPYKQAVRASWGMRIDAYLNTVDDIEAAGWTFEDLGGQKLKVELPNGKQLSISPDLQMEWNWEGDTRVYYPEPNVYLEGPGLSHWTNFYSTEDGVGYFLEEHYDAESGVVNLGF